MRKSLLSLLLVLMVAAAAGQTKATYKIGVNINGLKDSTIYLAYHLGDKQYISDTIRLDSHGSGVFSGDEALQQGIYMVVLPGRKYFEMLMPQDQDFSVSCEYNDFINTLKFTGCDENNSFLAYQKKWVSLQQQAGALSKRMQDNKQNQDSVKVISEAEKKQTGIMKAYLNTVARENNGNLLSVIVKAMIPVDVPEFNIPTVIQNRDSARFIMGYNYNARHFFDNTDLTGDRLIRTPLLQARLNAFFSNVIIQAPDTVNKEIDRLLAKCKSNYKVFQFVAVYLFNHFRESNIMGHDAVMVKLADDIYLSGKADWVTKEFRDDLKKQIDMIRPNLIGKRAVNLVMDSYKGIFVSLDDVDKDFTILYFWEPNCGHCKEATPKLKAFYDKPRNYSLEVFAVCTTSEKAKWSSYIEENKLTWINGWDPERASHFDYYYNVQSTPMVYILDRNKKIIAKKISVEDIGTFIDNYRKFNSK